LYHFTITEVLDIKESKYPENLTIIKQGLTMPKSYLLSFFNGVSTGRPRFQSNNIMGL